MSLQLSKLNHFLKIKTKGKKGHFALKIDMSKAYDRVEWRLLNNVMYALGFAMQVIDTIMRCVTSASFSVLINGGPAGYFTPTRGLRQGDPLSPYLFILCAEGLSTLFQVAQESGSFRGISASRGSPRISHLFFADDSIIFRDATTKHAMEVRRILNKCVGVQSKN